ncbi:MAG TPA: hypothetical protein VNN10_12065 [Dehalococcoidia bacterium]|nr:hypothetical protein [Dehalococcoidia bacterium]
MLSTGDQPPRPPPEALRAAERVLRRRFGGRPRLLDSSALDGRTTVFRCRTEGRGLPDSVVLKMPRREEGSAYQATDMKERAPAWHLTNEWAALALLDARQADGPRLTPRLFGGDLESGVLVLEDLGGGESLAGVLLSGDAARAEAAMLAFARSLGRMHALSAGQEEAHSATLESLGRAGGDRLAAARRVREEIAKLPATFDELDFEWSPGMVDDVQQLTRAILEPGPLLVLSHGDPCPDNDRLVDGRLVLFDFERAGFRSAMVDAAYGRVPFPTCWCANRLPDYVVEGFEAAYRLELMKAVPEAGDDAFFERSLMEAAGWWLITTSNQLLTRALRFEERWGISTYRQRLLFRFEEFSRRAAASGHLEALGAWAWLMHERLRARWPEVEEMPLYPAFR